jgi:hypothetical protein
VTLEVPVMPMLPSPSPDFFSDNRLSSPTNLGLSFWMCLQPRDLNIYKQNCPFLWL